MDNRHRQRLRINQAGDAAAPEEIVEEIDANPPGPPNTAARRAALVAAAAAAVAATAAAGLPPALAAAGAVLVPSAVSAARLDTQIDDLLGFQSRLSRPVPGEKSLFHFVGSYPSLELHYPLVLCRDPRDPAAAYNVSAAFSDMLCADADDADAALPVAAGVIALRNPGHFWRPGPAQPKPQILMTSESVRVDRAVDYGPDLPVDVRRRLELAPPAGPGFFEFVEGADSTICGDDKKRDVEPGTALPGRVRGLASRRPWMVDVPFIDLGDAAIVELGNVPHGPMSRSPLGLCVAPEIALFERGYGVGFPEAAVLAAGVRLPARRVGAATRLLAGVIVLDNNGVAPPTAGRVFGAVIEVSFDWGRMVAAHRLRQEPGRVTMRGVEDMGDALGLKRRSWNLTDHVYISLLGTAGLSAAVRGLGPLEDADVLIVFELMASRPGPPFVAAWSSFSGFSFRDRAIQLAGARAFLRMGLRPPAQASEPMPRYQGFHPSNSMAVVDAHGPAHFINVAPPRELFDIDGGTALPLRFLFGLGMAPAPVRVRLALMPAYGHAFLSLPIDVTTFSFENDRFFLNVKPLVAAIDELPVAWRPLFNPRSDLRVSLALPDDVPGLAGDATRGVDLVVFVAANQAAFVPPDGEDDAAIAALVDIALVRTHFHYLRTYQDHFTWNAPRAFSAGFPELPVSPAAGAVVHLRTVAFAGAGPPLIRRAAIAAGLVVATGRNGWTGAVNADLEPGEVSVSAALREFARVLTRPEMREQLAQARRNGVVEHYSVAPDGVRVITFRVATDRAAATWAGLTRAQRQAPPPEGWPDG